MMSSNMKLIMENWKRNIKPLLEAEGDDEDEEDKSDQRSQQQKDIDDEAATDDKDISIEDKAFEDFKGEIREATTIPELEKILGQMRQVYGPGETQPDRTKGVKGLPQGSLEGHQKDAKEWETLARLLINKNKKLKEASPTDAPQQTEIPADNEAEIKRLRDQINTYKDLLDELEDEDGAEGQYYQKQIDSIITRLQQITVPVAKTDSKKDDQAVSDVLRKAEPKVKKAVEAAKSKTGEDAKAAQKKVASDVAAVVKTAKDAAQAANNELDLSGIEIEDNAEETASPENAENERVIASLKPEGEEIKKALEDFVGEEGEGSEDALEKLKHFARVTDISQAINQFVQQKIKSGNQEEVASKRPALLDLDGINKESGSKRTERDEFHEKILSATKTSELKKLLQDVDSISLDQFDTYDFKKIISSRIDNPFFYNIEDDVGPSKQKSLKKVVKEDQVKCPNCKKLNPKGSNFCGWCGTNLETGESAVDTLEPAKNTEESTPERTRFKLDRKSPKLQQLANAFVGLRPEQYAQLRQVISDKAYQMTHNWRKKKGFKNFADSPTALLFTDDEGGTLTLDPKITDIVPVVDAEGNPTKFEITPEDLANKEDVIKKIDKQIETKGNEEMDTDTTNPSQSGAGNGEESTTEPKPKQPETVPSASQRKSFGQAIKARLDTGNLQQIVDMVSVLKSENGSLKQFNEASGLNVRQATFDAYRMIAQAGDDSQVFKNIEQAMRELDTAKKQGDQKKTEEAEKKIEQETSNIDKKAERITGLYDKIKPKVAEKLAAASKMDKGKFESLKIMNSLPFVFFLSQVLSKPKPQKGAKLNEEAEQKQSLMNPKDVEKAIKDNINDVKFISSVAKINIEKIFKDKFNYELGSGIEFKGGDEEAPEENGEKKEVEATGLDAMLKLDGKEFLEAFVKFYRDNKLLDDSNMKNSIRTIFKAFSDLPVEEPAEQEAAPAKEETPTPEDDNVMPAEVEFDDSNEEQVQAEALLEGIYLLMEEEQMDELGQAIAVVTDVPDNIIPVEKVGELKKKLEAILKVDSNKVKLPSAIEISREEMGAILNAADGKATMRALIDLMKDKFEGSIPDDIGALMKQVLRKEPKAIMNLVDSSKIKMDIMDADDLANKLKKFFPPKEDYSDDPMMANLNPEERKVLAFINRVFMTRDVNIETSNGKELSFSGKDMKTRYEKSLKRVRFLDKQILPAIAKTLNQEATGAVKEGQEELQEFFSSKAKDEAISLVNTVEMLMGRDNRQFIGNYTNMVNAFKGSDFRKFYGDLKRLVNAFMNAELVELDGEELEPEEITDEPPQSGEEGSNVEEPQDSPEGVEDTGEEGGEEEVLPADIEIDDEEGDLKDLKTADETIKARALRILKNKKGKDLSSMKIFDFQAFVSTLIYFMKQEDIKSNRPKDEEPLQEKLDKGSEKMINGKELESILTNSELASEFNQIDYLFDGSLTQYVIKKYPFLSDVLKKHNKRKRTDMDLPSPAGREKMTDPDDDFGGEFEWSKDKIVSDKTKEKGAKYLTMQNILYRIDLRDIRKQVGLVGLKDGVVGLRFLTTAIITGVLSNKVSKAEPQQDVTSEAKGDPVNLILSKLNSIKFEDTGRQLVKDFVKKTSKLSVDDYPQLKRGYDDAIKLFKSKQEGGYGIENQKLINFMNTVFEKAKELKNDGILSADHGNVQGIENAFRGFNLRKLEESLKPIVERTLNEMRAAK